jgi:hypothetical protein
MAMQQGSATFSVVAKDAASSVLRGVGKQMGSLGKIGSSVFKTLAVVAAAAAAAIVAAAGAALKFAKSAILAAIEDDKEQQKLVATLKARGIASERNLAIVEDLIAAGEKLNFTDSETRKGIQAATQFTDKFARVRKILAVAQDLARSKEISLEKATILVGRAYNGNTTALSRMGVALDKNATKAETLAALNAKFGGVAAAYSKTLEGQFGQVRIAIDETVESIGYAIGGGEGLPTFTRLLEGIRPVLDDVLGEIKKNLPNIQRFSREMVEKFLAKLPGYVATAKRELPILIDKATKFIGSVAGFGKDIASFLGPEGLVSAGLFGLGTKMGGLGGGLGALFAEQFIKMGVDPITATITSTIAGALTAGIVQGLASTAASAAISKFLGLFKSIPVTPSIPVGVPGGTPTGVPIPGGGNIAGIAKSVLTFLGGLGVVFTAQTALQDQAVGAMQKGQDPLWKTLTMPWTWPGAVGDILRGGPELTKPIADGVTTGMEPMKAALLGRDINFTNETRLTLDGRVVAQSVSRYLARDYAASTGPRTGGR